MENNNDSNNLYAKWLNNELTEAEKAEFEQTEDFKNLIPTAEHICYVIHSILTEHLDSRYELGVFDFDNTIHTAVVWCTCCLLGGLGLENRLLGCCRSHCASCPICNQPLLALPTLFFDAISLLPSTVVFRLGTCIIPRTHIHSVEWYILSY